MYKTYDLTAQCGYISFSERKVSKTVPLNDSVICDLDDSGMLVGIELLSIPKESFDEIYSEFQLETVV